MKFRTALTAAVATAGIAAAGITAAAPASAETTTGKFGTWERIYDNGGAIITAWNVFDLKPSSDTIPNYPVAGKLWEATAGVHPIRGTTTPIIPNLNARADNGQNYQVLWQAFTPNGLSGATLNQGDRSKGKIYFDVTGAKPTKVVYNNGVEDLLVWQK
jgi:hypothetical protein